MKKFSRQGNVLREFGPAMVYTFVYLSRIVLVPLPSAAAQSAISHP